LNLFFLLGFPLICRSVGAELMGHIQMYRFWACKGLVVGIRRVPAKAEGNVAISDPTPCPVVVGLQDVCPQRPKSFFFFASGFVIITVINVK
jgi:hypothetical protein